MNMNPNRSVSIIVNNYNYEQFVRQAIDSALQQSHPHCEVIIVDDGSTDGSRDIITGYSNVATLVLKENGGQASAFNAGFAACHGDIIFFLDADDCLKPDTVETVLQQWDDPAIAKCHWQLEVIDESGNQTGDITPAAILQEGNLRELVADKGPNAYISPPTTGNAWSRTLLDAVLPMPETAYTISADNYLCMLAPLFGTIKTIEGTQGYYRLHGKNNFRGKILDEDLLQSKVNRYTYSCQLLRDFFHQHGIEVTADSWYGQSWLMQLSRSVTEIKEQVPEHASFILADADQWQVGDSIAGRHVIPFMERNNRYWGMPQDDEEAIAEIEKHPDAGFIFFASPVFWFKSHYHRLFEYLNTHHARVIDNERLLGYKLNPLA